MKRLHGIVLAQLPEPMDQGNADTFPIDQLKAMYRSIPPFRRVPLVGGRHRGPLESARYASLVALDMSIKGLSAWESR